MIATASVSARRLEAPPFELDLDLAPQVSFDTSSEAVLLHPMRRLAAPAEEFRTLRTRLGQMQAASSIQTVLLTSASPGDGKSSIAANLALAHGQLPCNPTLLCDFDLRSPSLHEIFGIDRAPGISDYLLGVADLHDCLRRIGASNLFVLPAGHAAINPLDLLHVKELARMMSILQDAFRWIFLDSPPLLAASDANVLAGMADGTLLVTGIGATTVTAMNEAITSLGQDNILGIVANNAC